MLSELWSVIFLLKTTSTNTPVCLPPPPPLLCLLLFFCLLAFLPRFIFPQNREWAGLSLVWQHWVFPTHLPKSCSDVRQISLQWACSHCLYRVTDAGMLEVYPWVKIHFPCLLLTPHCSHSLLCASGCEVQLRVALCSYCPALQFLCTYSSSAVLKCWHYINVKKKKCKKKKNPHTNQPIRSVFVYTRVRTSIPK